MGSSEKKISLGEHSYISKGAEYIYYQSGSKVITGKYCAFARGIKFYLGGNHRTDWVSTFPFPDVKGWDRAVGIKGHPTTKGNIVIGNDVWIGREAVIMSGVNIGDGAVIGCHAVVASDVEPYSIVVGNPAKEIRKRFDDKTIEQLLKIKWWDWPTKKVHKRIGMICSDNLEAFIEKYKIP